jgi:hypothetical protein
LLSARALWRKEDLMRRVCSCTAAVLLCTAIVFAKAAAADTIRITAGSAEVTGAGASVPTPIHLVGERGFTLDSLAHGVPGEFCFDQCVPGATVPLNVGWGGFDLPAEVTLDGITYHDVGSASVQSDATIAFVASAPLPPFSGNLSTVVAPFQFSGRFSSELASVDLVGAGTVTSTFRRITGVGDFDFYVQHHSVYSFESPSAVPEPGTMLLVAGGMLCGFRSRMRKR